MSEEKTVHALQYGQPLCEFSQDMPINWPWDHVWTHVADLKNINCESCKKKAEKLAQKSI